MLVYVNDIVLVGTVHADLDGFGRLETVLGNLQPSVIGVELSDARAKLLEGHYEYDVEGIFRRTVAAYLGLVERYHVDPDAFALAKQRYARPSVTWTVRDIAAMDSGAQLLAACCGFEAKVARAYAARHPGVTVRYIDLPEQDIDLRQQTTPAPGCPTLRNLRYFAANRAALAQGLTGVVALLRALQDAYYDEAGGIFRQRYEENVAHWALLDPADVIRRAIYDPRREPHMVEQIKGLRHDRCRDRCVVIVGATHLPGLSRRLRGCRHSSLSLFEVDVLREMAA
jgi:hypothetical protein